MIEPLIVDTSVWIDFFNGIDNDNVKVICEYLENNYPLFVCPVIIQEVLQGIKTYKEYNQVKDYLFALNILNSDNIEASLGAADIKLRQKGITIRKSNDCLITFNAYKYSFKIIHRNRDFDKIIMYYK